MRERTPDAWGLDRKSSATLECSGPFAARSAAPQAPGHEPINGHANSAALQELLQYSSIHSGIDATRNSAAQILGWQSFAMGVADAIATLDSSSGVGFERILRELVLADVYDQRQTFSRASTGRLENNTGNASQPLTVEERLRKAARFRDALVDAVCGTVQHPPDRSTAINATHQDHWLEYNRLKSSGDSADKTRSGIQFGHLLTATFDSMEGHHSASSKVHHLAVRWPKLQQALAMLQWDMGGNTRSQEQCPTRASRPVDMTEATAEPESGGTADEPTSASSVREIKPYALAVEVVTRERRVPVIGIDVTVNGTSIGTTNTEGRVGPTALREDASLQFEVTYENAAENLRKEVFTLQVSDIDAEASSYTAGQCRNFIAKVVDVLGTGSDALPGDEAFDDNYPLDAGDVSFGSGADGEMLLSVRVHLATLSLSVPYGNQNDVASETVMIPNPAVPGMQIPSAAYAGSRICMPTCTTMLINFWELVASDGSGWTRSEVMQRCYDEETDASRLANVAPPVAQTPAPWQWWDTARTAVQTVIDEDASATGTLMTRSTIPGTPTADRTDYQTIPSNFADHMADRLALGEPMILSIRHRRRFSHIILARGAVVRHDGHAQWIIFNDPYGNLACGDSVYGDLDISAPVGLRGTSTVAAMNRSGDVEAIQAVLKRLGHYAGDVNGVCDESSQTDPTVLAIRAFQGGTNPDGRVDDGGNTERRLNARLDGMDRSRYRREENEINSAAGAGADRGKHVYYNGTTEGGVDGKFRMRPEARFLIVTRTTEWTPAEVSPRLVPNV